MHRGLTSGSGEVNAVHHGLTSGGGKANPVHLGPTSGGGGGEANPVHQGAWHPPRGAPPQASGRPMEQESRVPASHGWGHHGCMSDTQASGSWKQRYWDPKQTVHLEKRNQGPSSTVWEPGTTAPQVTWAGTPSLGRRCREGNGFLCGSPLPRPGCNVTGWRECSCGKFKKPLRMPSGPPAAGL